MKTLKCALTLISFIASTLTVRAANRYWIASGTGNWNSTANWSTTSGGGSGASVPGSADVANFNNLGLGNCTITAGFTITSLIMNSGYTGTITQGANTVTISNLGTFAGGIYKGGSGTLTIGGNVTLSGTAFTFPATLNMNGNNWTYSAGTLDVTTNSSNVVFGNTVTFTGSETFNNIGYNNPSPYSMSFVLNTGTSFTVNGNISTSGISPLYFNGSTINLYGNLNLANTGVQGGGTTVIAFLGTANQAITGSLSIDQSNLPSININKPSGTLTFPALVTMAGATWTYTTGTLDVTTNNSTVVFAGGYATAFTGNVTLNNIGFENPTPYTNSYNFATGTTLTANGNMSMTGISSLYFNGGTINVNGNLNLTNTGTQGGGSTVITFTGTTNQAITSGLTIDQSMLPSVNINKPSGTLTFPALFTMAGAAWTYTAGTLDVTTNNSTVVFAGSYATTFTGSHTLKNIDFDNPTPYTNTYTFTSGTTLTASGNMSMTGVSSLQFSGGTINLNGNLNLTNTGTQGGGSTVIAFVGTTNQAITSSLIIDQSSLPAVLINKPSGTLTFPSLLTMAGATWTYTTGTLDVTTNNSTVVFAGSYSTTFTGSHSLNNIDFDNATPYTNTYTFTGGTILTAKGNMAMSGLSDLYFSGGSINLFGNLNLTNLGTGGGGSTVIAFVATTNQAITSSLLIHQSSLPSVNINKPSGTLTFPSLLTMAGSTWTYTTGALDVATNNSTVVFAGSYATTFTGSHTLNNIDFEDATPYTNTYTVNTGTTLSASGNMTMSGISPLQFNGGIINVFGNLILTNTATGGGGSTVITFVATTNQSIISSLPVYECDLPSININKPLGTLTFPLLITMTGSTWTYTAGTLDATTNNSTVVFGGNGTTITGNHTLNNITFDNSSPYSNFYTISAATTLTARGNMAMSGVNSLTFTNGTINLQGNLNLTNTSTLDGGTTVIDFMGTVSQSINSTLPVNQSILPSIGINKPSGTLSFPSLITMGGTSWTYTAGTVDANTNTSTVYFVGNVNIAANGMNFYNINVNRNNSTLTNNLSVNNNLSITGSGVLLPGTNTINLSGNWSDRATAGFTEATSTVNFNGTGVQTITTAGGENFASLTVNNTGAGIQLISNVNVSKTLTMTQGNIDLNSTNLTLGLSVGTNGTLVYTLGNIINAGSFTRWFKTGTIAIGSAAGLFPVGTATDNRPFSVSAPVAGPTTGGTMTMTYTDAATYTVVSFPDGIFTVQIRKDLKWALSTSTILGGTYNLGISGTGYGNIAAVNDLRLTLAGSVVGTAGVNAGTVSNPQVNRTGLTLANLTNTFFLASVNPGMTTLPVSLISFTAIASNDEVLLNWSTAEETNSAYYTIQRSTVGGAWEDLQQVSAAGTSNTTIAYKTYDPSPLPGVSQYRLMMTDRDGKPGYSDIQVVNFNSQTATIAVYPNPVSNNLYFTFPNTGKYQVTLLNELGQVMTGHNSSNSNNLILDVSAMRAGAYFIRIATDGGATEIRKIIIRR